MPLSPTQLKQLCEQYDLRPSKAYGQNYLISQKPIEDMVKAADLSKNDTVVEIGPGFGILSFALAERVEKIIAFEIEQRLRPYWDEHAPQNMQLIWGNVLHHLNDVQRELTDYKVVANLPYQITSHILRAILESDHKPSDIVVMVQKEVAERICAQAGDMSLLAVSVQYYGTPRIASKVPKGNFWPIPKVDSAVVHIRVSGDHVPKKEVKTFFTLVKAGFSNKRKQLVNNLVQSGIASETIIRKALIDLCGNEKVRAQELSVAEWRKLQDILERQ